MLILAIFFRQKNNKLALIFAMFIRYTVFEDDLPITLETAVGLFSRMTSGNNHRKK